MADDLPSDVHSVLTQTLESAAARAEAGDEELLRLLDTVERVATNKLPEGDRRGRLQHGCGLTRDVFAEGEHDVAAEYCRSMLRVVADDDG